MDRFIQPTTDFLGGAPIGIFYTDIDGDCSFVNSRWSQITGISPEDVNNAHWCNALHPDDCDRITTNWAKAVAERQPFRSEHRYLHPNNKITWVIAQAFPDVGPDGNYRGYIGTLTDITEHKELEQTLGRFQYEDEKGRMFVRPLMTNDEIRKMDVSRAILICGHHSPIQAKMQPFFRNGRFREYSMIPPPQLQSKIPFNAVPLLPISDSQKDEYEKQLS